MSSPEEESGTPPPSTAEGDTLSPTNELEEVVPPPADETDVASDPEDIEENDDTEAESVVAGEDVNMEDTYEAEAKDPIEDLGDESAEAHPPTSDSEDPGADPATDDAAEKSDDATTRSEAEQVTEESAAALKELPYSTRGRSSDKDAGSGDDKKTSSIDALEDIGHVKESSPAALGVSFLESLTEEERRTRTRFIPDVEGMHALRKHEVKDDLILARSLVSSSGMTSLKRSKKRTDDMDVEEEGGASPSEDGSADASSRPRTKLVELPTRDLIVPSNAFISSDEDVQTTSISALKTQNGIKSPLLVDSVSGFNPPRPPESVGAKKKHRMLRWERRPEDVEVDLNTYKKTVQRTRQELQKAEAEYNRLETMDAHLRWNFLSHLSLVNEEYTRLNEEISNVQQECVKAADLLTSRTRSRGAGKGGYVMKDVLGVLKAKGAENVAALETMEHPIVENPVAGPGIGGLAPSAFGDWNRQTKLAQKEPASAWTVPGEKVKTPFGNGVVVEVFPPESAPRKKDNKESKAQKSSEIVGKSEEGKDGTEGGATDNEDGADGEGAQNEDEKVTDTNDLCTHLTPRVSVKLPIGLAVCPFPAIESIDNPCLFSDAKLVDRWSHIVKTAMAVGGTIDLEGMNFNSKTRPSASESVDAESKTDMEAPLHQTEEKSPDERGNMEDDVDEEHFMPFGSGLLPTASGRGNLLHLMSIEELEQGMENALYHGCGVLGKVGIWELKPLVFWQNESIF